METERLVIRPVTPFDLEALLAVHADEEVVRWQGYPQDPMERRTKLYDGLNRLREPDPRGLIDHWVVCDRATGEVVGEQTLLAYAQLMRGRACETGGSLKDGWRSKGYGTEVVTAVVRLAAEHLGYDTMLAGSSPANEGALRLYQRCGFQRFRTRPGWVLPNGGTLEVVVLRREQDAHHTCKRALRQRFF